MRAAVCCGEAATRFHAVGGAHRRQRLRTAWLPDAPSMLLL